MKCLDDLGITHYTINDDLSVNTIDNINLTNKKLNSFPLLKFNKICGNVILISNEFKTLHNIHKHFKCIHGKINFIMNPVRSNVLGVMHIKGLQKVYLNNHEVEYIINKHLQSKERDIHSCQEELIQAGFSEYAKI